MVRGFDQVTDRLRQLDGFEGSYVLVDRNSGKAATITLWSSEQAVQASAQQADEMRSQMAQAGSHSIESVETYEVALRVDTGSASWSSANRKAAPASSRKVSGSSIS